MKKIKQINFLVEITRTGVSAFSELLPIYSTGKTISELIDNLIEASNLYFEDDGITINSKDINLEFDFKQFFKNYKIINAKYLARRIKINETLLSQYVIGKKKPSKKQVDRILEGIREIGKELTELQFITN
jgi:predicted RNase H-like HicB family nuclease